MQTGTIYDGAPGFAHSAYFFTGKERDAESGLDYFGARYYASNMGRWTSPDPSGLYFANPSNPQTLNLYGYVGNNPLVFTDPTGLATDCDGKPDKSVVCAVTQAFDWLKNHLGGGGGGSSPAPGTAQAAPQEPLFFSSSRILPPAEFGRNNGNIVNSNIREASLFRYTPPGMATAYIYLTYHTGGPADYKKGTWMANDDIDGKMTIVPDSYMDFGNLNYGEASRAAGLPAWFYQRAPGMARQHTELGLSWPAAFIRSFMAPAPFGDQERDQHYISGDRTAAKDDPQ